jgi:hypothetical protein
MTHMKKEKNSYDKSSRKKQRRAPTDNDEQRELPAAEKEGQPSAVSRSRRSFLGRVTAAAVAASVLGVPKLANAQEESQMQVLPPEDEYGTTYSSSCTTGCDIEIQTPVQRANTSLARRVKAALLERTAGIPPHPCNGDETLYKNQNYIGSYTKGLRKINNLGEVDPIAYCSLLNAIRTANPRDFNAIILGCVPCSTSSSPYQTQQAQVAEEPGAYSAQYYSDQSSVPAAQGSSTEQNEMSAAEQSSLYDGPEQTAAQESTDQQAAAYAQAQYVPLEETARLSSIGVASAATQRRLVNPQEGYNYELEGIDSHQLAVPPAPAFASADDAAEMAELYWHALARDVPFIQYSSNSTIASAVSDLNTRFKYYAGLPQYEIVPPGRTPRLNPRGFPTSPTTPLGQVPGPGNNITTQTIFRGFTKTDIKGPYLSQFIVRDVPYGRQTIFNTLQPLAPNINYMTNQTDWLNVQKGCKPGPPALLGSRRRIVNGRDLASYVQMDAITEAYWNALWLMIMLPDPARLDGGGLGIPFDPNNPYVNNCTQEGFVSFGPGHVVALLNKAAFVARKGTWFNKWQVHRRLRPEEFGGRVHFTLKNIKQYPYNYVLHNSTALPLIASQNGGNYFLPQAFPEGSPIHPSYTAGHATLSGACATILKAFFDDQALVPNPVQTDASGNLVSYTGPDANQLTVGGELNKLAYNIGIGRHFAGVHWRSDFTASMLLGEDFAIHLLTDYGFTYNENFAGFSFTDFRGKRRTGIGRKRT